MLTIHSEDHALQNGRAELNEGRLVPCFEMPRRAELIRARILEVGLGEVRPPGDLGRGPLARVHADDYLQFLEGFWDEWVEAGRDWDALPMSWPVPGLRRARPRHLDGRLGFYSFDAGTPVTAGTWRAAYTSAQSALAAASLVASGAEPAVFALCRPPGHHAASDLLGGYCFLNNAAIAAQSLIDGGAERVALLDIDYHHGNGSQAIFWERGDVLVLSLHADPDDEFPYFLGRADETGAGAGEGANVNYPMPPDTGFERWSETLREATGRIERFAPDVLVVSLGVDTFVEDPISRFRLRTDDFEAVGRHLRSLGLPTVFVMEGGYAVDAIGINVVNVLAAFEDG